VVAQELKSGRLEMRQINRAAREAAVLFGGLDTEMVATYCGGSATAGRGIMLVDPNGEHLALRVLTKVSTTMTRSSKPAPGF